MVTAVVLAGGQSSRMGQPKQLLAYDGSTLLRRVLENLIRSAADDIVVVLGHEADTIGKTLLGLKSNIVINRDYAAGLSTSLRAGLKELQAINSGNRDIRQAALFVLGDQPLIQPATYNAIMAAHQPGKIVVPTFKGQRGNPVLIDSYFFAEVEQLRGDVGARTIMARHPEALVNLAVSDANITRDVDTWMDYQQLTEGGV